MKIAIGCDHAGFSLRETVIDEVTRLGHEVVDHGLYERTSADFPDFAALVGASLQRGDAERGILLCGSGVGMCIAANKLRGVRACVTHDTYSARQGVEHDGMNVLCLGARVVGDELARELMRAFLAANFQREERFLRRLNKINALEAGADAK
jgi:ribose 5-phosphate isomerase B